MFIHQDKLGLTLSFLPYKNMNQDVMRYKSRFVTVALLLGYAYLHTQLTGTYIDSTLRDMFNFSARLPFGQRLLTPAIAHLFFYVAPLSVDKLFFLIECGFVTLFYFSLRTLLEHEFKPRQAKLLSWLFLLLLPLMTVVNYRYTASGGATFFYPYDTASLFFMTMGFLLCLRQQWGYFIALVFIATFNRETSILLVFMIPALHWQKVRTVLGPFLLAFLTFCLARVLTLIIVFDMPGTLMEWYFRASTHTYFEMNLLWLFDQLNILLFLFCLSGLPLFWFAFYDYIPEKYKPLRYIALFCFLSLLLVGNFMEARVFTEILVLLYMPVCVAISGWLMDLKPEFPTQKGIIYYVNRVAILSILVAIALLRGPLNTGVIWLSHHSP